MASLITDGTVLETRPDGTPFDLALINKGDGAILYADTYTELVAALAESLEDEDFDSPSPDDHSDEADKDAALGLYEFATRAASTLQHIANEHALATGYLPAEVGLAYQQLDELFANPDADMEVDPDTITPAATIAFITHPDRKDWRGDNAIVTPGGTWDTEHHKLYIVAQNYDNVQDAPRGAGVVVIDAHNEKTLIDSLAATGAFELLVNDDEPSEQGETVGDGE